MDVRDPISFLDVPTGGNRSGARNPLREPHTDVVAEVAPRRFLVVDEVGDAARGLLGICCFCLLVDLVGEWLRHLLLLLLLIDTRNPDLVVIPFRKDRRVLRGNSRGFVMSYRLGLGIGCPRGF